MSSANNNGNKTAACLTSQNPLDMFLRNFPHGRGSCRLVANLLAIRRCNGIWENDTTQQTQRTFECANLLQTCCGLVVYVVDLLRTC